MEMRIRKTKIKDAKGFSELWNEGLKRGIFKYTGNNKFRKPLDVQKNFKQAYASKERISYVALDDSKCIGFAFFNVPRFDRTRHRGELGWFVHPDYAGKGVATKLLGVTLQQLKAKGYKRAEAEIALGNTPSIKLAKKLGFKNEGRRKAGMLLDNGRYVDTYLFGKILN